MRKAVRAIIVKDDKLLLMHRNKFGQEYFILVGGGIDFGETGEQALRREVMDESGVTFSNPRLVIVQESGDLYGTQYIYLCDYSSGEPALQPRSQEAQIHAMGQNLYTPLWLPVSELQNIPFVAPVIKQSIIDGLKNGFADQPKVIHGL